MTSKSIGTIASFKALHGQRVKCFTQWCLDICTCMQDANCLYKACLLKMYLKLHNEYFL